MIRVFSFLHKIQSHNSSSEFQLLKILLSAADKNPGPCPACGSREPDFIKIRPYVRMMIFAVNGRRIIRQVYIPRVKCRSCGATHAILPEVLIPYGSYTPGFIYAVLEAYLTRSCRVDELCAHWQISVSTLYGWIHSFTDQFSASCDIFQRISRVTDEVLSAVRESLSFLSDFFLRFGFSFLQFRHPATPSSAVP